jgi:hypothetical protein
MNKEINEFCSDGIIHAIHLHMPINKRKSILCGVPNIRFYLAQVILLSFITWICLHSKTISQSNYISGLYNPINYFATFRQTMYM